MNHSLAIRQHLGHVLGVPWRTIRVIAEHRARGWVVRVRCDNAKVIVRHHQGPLAVLYGREVPLRGYLYGASRTRREALAWGARLVRSYLGGRLRVFNHNAGRRV